jgi:hypothetical protein
VPAAESPVGAYEQQIGISSVSSFAHLGGAFVGLVGWHSVEKALASTSIIKERRLPSSPDRSFRDLANTGLGADEAAPSNCEAGRTRFACHAIAKRRRVVSQISGGAASIEVRAGLARLLDPPRKLFVISFGPPIFHAPARNASKDLRTYGINFR